MLRSYLDDITNNGNVSSHRELIESLRGIAPHTIEVFGRSGDNLLYNCVMYALGLAQDPVFLYMLHELPSRIQVLPSFNSWLTRGISSNRYLLMSEILSPITITLGSGTLALLLTMAGSVPSGVWDFCTSMLHSKRHIPMAMPSAFSDLCSAG